MTQIWMGFIMLSWLNKNNKNRVLILFFCLFIEWAWAEEYKASVQHVEITTDNSEYIVNADIVYRLSPIAKEALQKGISLTWVVMVKVQREGLLWDTTLQELEIAYQIQSHALLNLYSVKKMEDGTINMFSTLTAALNSISKIRDLSVIEKKLILPGESYQIAIKVLFNREALPVPLRPMSYFNSEWALSSHWSLWQLQK